MVNCFSSRPCDTSSKLLSFEKEEESGLKLGEVRLIVLPRSGVNVPMGNGVVVGMVRGDGEHDFKILQFFMI